jgi:hypothetical protein
MKELYPKENETFKLNFKDQSLEYGSNGSDIAKVHVAKFESVTSIQVSDLGIFKGKEKTQIEKMDKSAIIEPLLKFILIPKSMNKFFDNLSTLLKTDYNFKETKIDPKESGLTHSIIALEFDNPTKDQKVEFKNNENFAIILDGIAYLIPFKTLVENVKFLNSEKTLFLLVQNNTEDEQELFLGRAFLNNFNVYLDSKSVGFSGGEYVSLNSPWWMEKWFIIGAVVVFLAIVFLIYCFCKRSNKGKKHSDFVN